MKFANTVLLLLASISLSAQTVQQHYAFRVYLKDKGNTEFSVSDPGKFLSQQAIERKKTQQANIDESDFPISPDYFVQMKSAGGDVIAHSKWLKTITVQLKDSAQINNIRQLSFVDSAKYVWKGIRHPNPTSARPRLVTTNYDGAVFGFTQKQFALHNAEQMARAGFCGKGKRVAVIDAGFTNFDVIPLFNGILLGGFKDFVPSGDIFSSSDHGTRVLSAMAVNQPGVMTGSAPEAAYWLLRSEDASSEFPVEEDYWVRAVEYADSIGIDLINTSLGYSTFDDKLLNYSHNDLDGKTVFMTRAANLAVEKGILMVASAGNEGNKAWGKTTPPSDAAVVLTVGAVDTDSVIAPFSSRGTIADGRLKPDVVSVGKGTVTVGYRGLVDFANGTSFSSPFLAGLVASLWSANPDLHHAEVTEIVKKSSDRYNRPDSVYGMGIPDFGKALKTVLQTLDVNKTSVAEKYFSLVRTAKDTYVTTLTEPDFSFDAYQINLLDESGNLISEHGFESGSLQISIPPQTRKTNQFVHFVFKSPYTQKTVRFKL